MLGRGVNVKAQLFIKKHVLYIRFSGELDSSVANGLRIKVTELIENYKIKYLVLNCEKLTFMDSSGIGFIIGRYNQLQDIGGAIFMTNLNELLRKIVKISGVYKLVCVKSNEDEVNELLEVYNGKIHENAI